MLSSANSLILLGFITDFTEALLVKEDTKYNQASFEDLA